MVGYQAEVHLLHGLFLDMTGRQTGANAARAVMLMVVIGADWPAPGLPEDPGGRELIVFGDLALGGSHGGGMAVIDRARQQG